ncbi:ribose 5-phosphate isomerase B [bacterium]|nr:ribose 5-phosphate isomerase B [bacterium]
MSKSNTVYVASDHGGIDLKTSIFQKLAQELDLVNLGTDTIDSVDYPDYADLLCKKVIQESAKGILICGTGIGISIRANRHVGIRAALVYSEFTAEMAKAHNDANVLCLGARTTAIEDAIQFILKWHRTTFEGGRHQVRIDKIDSKINLL